MAVWQATLGDEPVNAVRGFGWTLAYGVKPQVRVFPMTRQRAERIEQKRVVTLKIWKDDEPERTVEVKGLLVIELNASQALKTLRMDDIVDVVVADPLADLIYRAISRKYNFRRKSGLRRLVGSDLIDLAVSVPDYEYRRLSLNEEKPWTTQEMLLDAAERLFPGGLDQRALPARTDNPEGITIQGRGDRALAYAISRVPGAKVFHSASGLPALENQYSGSERAVFQRLLGKGRNSGSFRLVSKRLRRPKLFEVLLDRLVELRFDFVEDSNPTIAPGREPRILRNVIRNPLKSLEIPNSGSVGLTGKFTGAGGDQAIRKSHEGEWLELRVFLAAINRKLASELSSGRRKKNRSQIDLAWLKRNAFNRYVDHAYAFEGLPEPSVEWGLIMAAIRRHWRSHYQVLPQWRDKVFRFFPKRIAVADQESGTLAQATVYTSFIRRFRGVGRHPLTGARTAVQEDHYAERLDDATGSSPFEVRMVDPEEGVFSLEGRVDQGGVTESLALGNTSSDEGLVKLALATRPVQWGEVQLDAPFRLTVVLSVSQFAPNDLGRFHKVEVSLSDAARTLGVEADEGTIERQQVFADLNGEPARFAWLDDRAADIENAFYDGTPLDDSLLVNTAEVYSIARAHAAAELVPWLDRIEGRLEVKLTPVEPTGNLKEVRHEISPGGGLATTTIVAGGDFEPPDVNTFLPEGVKRLTQRRVDLG